MAAKKEIELQVTAGPGLLEIIQSLIRPEILDHECLRVRFTLAGKIKEMGISKRTSGQINCLKLVPGHPDGVWYLEGSLWIRFGPKYFSGLYDIKTRKGTFVFEF